MQPPMRDVLSPMAEAPSHIRISIAQQHGPSLLERARPLPPSGWGARRNPAQHPPLVRGHQGAVARRSVPRRPSFLAISEQVEKS